MPDDRLWPGIQPPGSEPFAQFDDQADNIVRRASGRGERPTRTRLERCLALLVIAGDQLRNPAFRHLIVPGTLGLGTSLEDNSSDDQTGL